MIQSVSGIITDCPISRFLLSMNLERKVIIVTRLSRRLRTCTVCFFFPAKVKIAGIHIYHVFADLHKQEKIRCDFEGHPSITVTWKKAGRKGGSPLLVSDRIHQQDNTLYFKPVEKEDEGQYFCKGENSFSSAESYVNVSVIGK